MKEVEVIWGMTTKTVKVPDDATVVRKGDQVVDPPALENPAGAIEKVLDDPSGMDPIEDRVSRGDQVVIAVPDRVKGGTHQESHRKLSIPIILDRLESAGVKEDDIKFIITNGLHCKNTRAQMEKFLPDVVFEEFAPHHGIGNNLVNHDSEDPEGIVDLGYDEFGNRVEINRDVYESDLTIALGHCQGNPYAGMSGGAKSVATGLTTWRSISSHHVPETMWRDDMVPASHESLQRKQFHSIVEKIEEEMGNKIMFVDGVLGSNAQILGEYAGTWEKVQEESWELADKRTEVYLDMEEKADILVFGEPRDFHYGPGMGTNPILMRQAIGANYIRSGGVLKDDSVIITPALCDGWFNEDWFPSYEETYELYQNVVDSADMEKYEKKMSTNEEYIHKYRYEFAFHPFHAFSMLNCGEIAVKNTSEIFIPWAEKPGYARGMGLTPTRNFEEAMAESERHVGKDPKVVVFQGSLTYVPPHLFAK